MTTLRETLREVPDSIFVDLLESDEAYLLVIDLPGASADTTTVRTSDGRIFVDVHRAPPEGDGYRLVRSDRPESIDIDLPIPGDADSTNASATLERGVLELRIPKGSGGVETTIPIDDT